ncbi:efflux RND transporter periplasmic adaptor subunit [Chitinophagaceae bacterium LWZ2-11]
MKRSFIYITVLLGLLSCKSKPAEEDKKAHSENETIVTLDSLQLKNAGIVIAFPQMKTMHTTVKVTGAVDVPPQSLVSISFPLGGYLKSTPLLPGFHVNKGQVIAIMEDQSYVQLQQDYLTAKARMEYLDTDVQRQKELSDADATSKKNYQLVLSEFKTQQILLKALDEKLRIINIQPANLSVQNISRTIPIYSPINGYVTKVNVNIGKYVNPADVLFELVNPTDIHAGITVFEKDINLFSKGTKGKVALLDKPNEWYDVEAILVTKNIDASRTGLVHCHFENPIHDLLPGMFLTGVFELDNKNVLTVPENALVRYAGKQYVFVTDDGKTFSLTPVEPGSIEKGFVELKVSDKGDLSKQKIVTEGAFALLSKLKNKGDDDH